MIPTSWLSVLFYLLLVAPGLLYDLLATRRRPLANESTFREISRIILASLIFSIVSFSLLLTVGSFIKGWLPDITQLLFHPSVYLPGHYFIAVRALITEGIIAFALVGGLHLAQLWRTDVRLRPVSTWTRVLRQELPRGCVPYVEVRLDNGMTYIGRVGHFTADLDSAERELVLVPYLYIQAPGGVLTDMPHEWQRLIISGDQIQSMTVQYRPVPTLNQTRSWLQKVYLRTRDNRPSLRRVAVSADETASSNGLLGSTSSSDD